MRFLDFDRMMVDTSLEQSPRVGFNSPVPQSWGKRTGLCAPPHDSFAAFLCASCASPAGLFHGKQTESSVKWKMKAPLVF